MLREVHDHLRQQVAVGLDIVVAAQTAASGNHALRILRVDLQRIQLQTVQLAEVRRHAVGHQQRLARTEPRLAEIVETAFGGPAALVTAFKIGKQPAVFGPARRIGLDPTLQTLLFGLTDRLHVETAKTLVLPLGVIGIVAQPEIGVGILHAHLRIALHMALKNIHPVVAVGHDDGILDTLFLGHGKRRSVTVRMARKSDHHRKVAVVHAARRNTQYAAGLERHVAGGILRRTSLRVGIHPVERKVALVLGPAPVVVIAAESTQRDRRSSDQPHVLIDVVIEHQVHFAAPHRVARHFVFGLRGITVLDLLIHAAHAHYAPFSFGHHAAADRLDLLSHIYHLAQEPHGLAGHGNLLPARTSPKTRFEVVVFGRRKGADVAERDVVVGYHQPFVGDHASRSHAAVHGDYGVGERRSLLVVNLLVLYLQPLGLHLRVNLPQPVDQPHAFVGHSGLHAEQHDGQTGYPSSHIFHLHKTGGNRQPIPSRSFYSVTVLPGLVNFSRGSASLKVPSAMRSVHFSAWKISFQSFSSFHIDFT